eukprot:CAMPEP_0119564292 /NCGR_PEP_ID=MMETSP1352-20130426/26508_1 /TAXON_ID=265584 /ORGANISM="Stauroneis constricta, Strain CCMP1120" /LENGTH=327 /DNA_ID=CAMNT_0007613035 /DNA_START=113 /DNA_END=1096 /DNA_ORIENTATION=-
MTSSPSIAVGAAAKVLRHFVRPSGGSRSALRSMHRSYPEAAAVGAGMSVGRSAFHSMSNAGSSPWSSKKSPMEFPTRSKQVAESRRSVFIQTEDTPNPESLKFVPSNTVVLEITEENPTAGFFVTHSDAASEINRSPLAKKLFRIEGVKAVYLGADFVTITKFAQNKWQLMRPEVFSTMMDFFDSNQPALLDQPEITDTTILDDDDEVVAMIKELMEARIRPAVQEDGGDIRYVGFEEETGLVTVQLAGSCVGCPSSSVTLKQGVENMLMHYIPEVTSVVALEEESDESSGDGAGAGEVNVETTQAATKKDKSYEERLAAAGIPFSD